MLYSCNPNDVVRKYVFDSSIDEKSKASFYQKILKSTMIKEKEADFLKMTVLPILFLDSYKLLSERVKSGYASPAEIQMYSVYDDIQNNEDLMKLFKKRHDYILYSIEAVKGFYEMPLLGKIKQIKSLTNYENCFLDTVSSNHLNDLDTYDFDITEDFLYNFFQRYCNKLRSDDLVFTEVSISAMVAGFIQNTYIYSPSEIYQIICIINEKVFTNLDKIKSVTEMNDEYINELSETYYSDSDYFNQNCLYDNGVLIDTVTIYFKMRDLGLIDNKVYKNERNE